MLASPPDRLCVSDGFGMPPACLQALSASHRDRGSDRCPPDIDFAAMVGADGLEPPTLSV
jgi:hypothetical protein